MRLSLTLFALFLGKFTTAERLPSITGVNLTFPVTPLIEAAFDYAKEHTSRNTLNHCVRSAYWALILGHKHPNFVGKEVEWEVVILSVIMHDLGWATTKSLLSPDKRFEVDGADLARAFIRRSSCSNRWDKRRLQLVWDSIALHANPSIARYKETEVALAQIGIQTDFFGTSLPGGFITEDEYEAVVDLFPRTGFREDFINILCGLCREKPATTYDNFVGEYGKEYGLDGNGTNRTEYRQDWEDNQIALTLAERLGNLERL